jgi:hypothetical protein
LEESIQNLSEVLSPSLNAQLLSFNLLLLNKSFNTNIDKVNNNYRLIFSYLFGSNFLGRHGRTVT